MLYTLSSCSLFTLKYVSILCHSVLAVFFCHSERTVLVYLRRVWYVLVCRLGVQSTPDYSLRQHVLPSLHPSTKVSKRDCQKLPTVMGLPRNLVHAVQLLSLHTIARASLSSRTKPFGFGFIFHMMLDVSSLSFVYFARSLRVTVSEAYMNDEVSSPCMKEVLNVNLRVISSMKWLTPQCQIYIDNFRHMSRVWSLAYKAKAIIDRIIIHRFLSHGLNQSILNVHIFLNCITSVLA